jgi:DNA-binding ferritin-like protein
MKNLAILLRALQLYAHNAHVVSCKGPSFRSDHKMLGHLYADYTVDYDAVVERMVGLTGTADVKAITKSACEVCCASETPADAATAFSMILKAEHALCDQLTKENLTATLGTQDLIQKLAGNSETRQFQLRERLA